MFDSFKPRTRIGFFAWALWFWDSIRGGRTPQLSDDEAEIVYHLSEESAP